MKIRIIITILLAFMIASCMCLVSAGDWGSDLISEIETEDISITVDSDNTSTDASPSEIVDNLIACTWEGSDLMNRKFWMEFYSDGSGVTSITYEGEPQTTFFSWILSGTQILVMAKRIGHLEYHDENGNLSLLLYNESGEIDCVFTPLETDDMEGSMFEEKDIETEVEEFNMVRPEFDISDYLTIEDDEYLKMVIQVEAAQGVTEEEIDQEILNNLYNLDGYDDLIIKKTEGIVEEGDTVNIDYVGTIDGAEFDGGTVEGYELEIGSGMFIEGFEEGLIGKEIGSTVDLYLTFPEDYGDEELNGEDVEYTATINYVVEIPEITDEIAEKASDGAYTTVDGYRESIRSDLQSTYDGEREYEIEQAIWEKLMELYPIKAYPQEYVDYKTEQILSVEFGMYASMFDMSVEEFIEQAYGRSLEEAMVQLITPEVNQRIAKEIISGVIAQKEGIAVTDEELQERIQEDADISERDVDEYMKGYDIEDIRAYALNYKMIDWLRDRVTIEEEAFLPIEPHEMEITE